MRADELSVETLLSTIQDGISVLDTDLIVRRVNPVMNRWYARNQPLEGKKCHVCYHDEAQPCDPCPSLRAMASGRPESDIVPGLPGSEVEWVELFAHPVLDPVSGQIQGVVEFVRDITARKRAEQARLDLEVQFQQAQKLESLGVLAGGIAHDFNNLLVGILGNAELALMDIPPESPARQMVDDIEMAAKRAAELIRQMLAYSGKGRFVIKQLDLRTLVQEMAHLLDASISKKVHLSYKFSDRTPAVEADATQIRQIVMNLITNGSDAIGDDVGVITVRTEGLDCDRAYLSSVFPTYELEPGRYALLQVDDTGAGMTDAVRTRIFDPFFTTKFTGRGLGMAAVLGIVRGHRGAIRVDSSPGRGSSFQVLLPAFVRTNQPGIGHEPSDLTRPG